MNAEAGRNRARAAFEQLRIARPGAFIAGFMVVVALGLFLRVNSALWRPLEHDEISSTNAYTSVGYISKISELRAERGWNVRRLADGLARTLIDWRNPNNHMIHELALSVGVFFLGASEATVRAAALAASIWTACLLMFWAQRHTGRVLVALFCGMAIAVHPYFIYYGEAARGYTFTALLLVVNILLMDGAVGGKRGLARLALSTVAEFALFLNLTSTLFIWLAPLYTCMLWREGRKEGGIRSEAFGWWLFQASAVGSMVVFFTLEHLPMFLQAQGDYGVKFPTGMAALRRLLDVIPYLFPGQWMLLAAAGAIGWLGMVKSKYWLAVPIGSSFLVMLVYVMVTRTVPYDRTFGVWIVFATMSVAWLLKECAAAAWVPAVAAAAMVGAAIVWPHSMLSGPDYADTAVEISREIGMRGETPANTFIPIPFLSYEECRLYLPDDAGFVSLAATPPAALSIYLPCKSFDGNKVGFRCTYYHRNAAEMFYFQLPASWLSHITWSKGECSIARLDATVASGVASISKDIPQIVIWRAANSFFEQDRYVEERILKNPALPELYFVPGYYSPSPSLLFFVNGDADAVKKALAELAGTTPGSVLVLTPKE